MRRATASVSSAPNPVTPATRSDEWPPRCDSAAWATRASVEVGASRKIGSMPGVFMAPKSAALFRRIIDHQDAVDTGLGGCRQTPRPRPRSVGAAHEDHRRLRSSAVRKVPTSRARGGVMPRQGPLEARWMVGPSAGSEKERRSSMMSAPGPTRAMHEGTGQAGVGIAGGDEGDQGLLPAEAA